MLQKVDLKMLGQLSTQVLLTAQMEFRIARPRKLYRDNAEWFYYDYNPNLSTNVGYSCVLIDMNPESYKVTANPTDGTFVVPISADALSSIRINWENTTPPLGGTPYEPIASLGNWPSSDAVPNSLETAALRVTVLPGFSGGTLSRDRLRNESHTMFLYPSAGGSNNISYLGTGGGTQGGSRQGDVVSGNCGSGGTGLACSVDIRDLNLVPNPAVPDANEEYYLVIKPYTTVLILKSKALMGAVRLA
jgi:hypothetical protein